MVAKCLFFIGVSQCKVHATMGSNQASGSGNCRIELAEHGSMGGQTGESDDRTAAIRAARIDKLST